MIFLTARAEVENEARGFEYGAADYITKPISPPTLLARVRTQLAMKEWRDFLQNQNTYLEAEVARRTRQVQLTDAGHAKRRDVIPLWQAAQSKIIAAGLGHERWSRLYDELQEVVRLAQA